MNETILVAEDSLNGPLAALAREACGKARTTGHGWKLEDPAPTGVAAPALLIGGLRQGDRRIPDALLRAVNETFPGLPLILLSEETLVRPSVVLQNGRALLLGPPHTAEGVAQHLRTLLEGEAHPSAESGLSVSDLLWADAGPVVTREFLRTHWWVATVAGRGGSGDHAQFLPQLRQGLGEGLTVCLAASDNAPPPQLSDNDFAHLSELLEREETASSKEQAVAEFLGERAAFMHLAAGADHWMFYLPTPNLRVWLTSPLRLPNVWDVSAGMQRSHARLLRMDAAGSDLVFAALGAGGPGVVESLEQNIMHVCKDGGPMLLDVLEGRLRQTPLSLSGTMIEVR